MRLYLSPFELTQSSPAAAAAMLLASDDAGLRTLLPAPFAGSGPADTFNAARHAPSYHRLIESWHWTTPLWRAGLLTAARQGRQLADDLLRIASALAADPAFQSAPHIFPLEAFGDEASMLEAVSRDILRGGVDPGIHVPLNRLTESLAADEGAPIMASDHRRPVARCESPNGSASGGITLSVLLHADADAILTLRDWLAPELDALRAALPNSDAPPASAARTACLRAADNLNRAFNDRLPRIHRSGTGNRAVLLLSQHRADEGHAADLAASDINRFVPPASTRRKKPASVALATRARPIAFFLVKRSAWDSVL